MKKNYFRSIILNLLVIFISTTFYRCGGGSSDSTTKDKYEQLSESTVYKLEKSPVEVVGKKVKINIECNFPENYANKGYQVVLRPYLENKEGKVQNFQEIIYKEGQDFTYEEGGNREYEAMVDYDPDMNISVLFMNIVIRPGQEQEDENEEELTQSQNNDQDAITQKVKLGEGIIITPLLVDLDYKPLFVNNNFSAGGSNVGNAIFGFKKNSFQVKKEDLNTDKFSNIKVSLNNVKSNKIKINSIDIIGYASPEGPLKFNEILSINRAKAVKSQIQRILKDSKIKISDDLQLIRGEGPDWNGFFEMIQMSAVSDKDLIRKTLQDEPLLEARAETLKRFIEAYPDIERDILSNLRRVELKIVYSEGEKGNSSSPKELLVKVDQNLSKMSYEDLVDVISYIDDNKKRLTVAQEMINKNPKDYKGYNNYGVSLWLENRKDEALSNFMKAFDIEKNEITNSNIAVTKIDNGEYEQAYKLVENVTLPQAMYNKGIILFMEGNYKESLNYIGEKNIFNKSLATLLSGDIQKSMELLSTVTDDKLKYDYLRGIIYARENNIDEVNNIVTKFSQDQELANRYKTDIEYKMLFDQQQQEEDNSEKVEPQEEQQQEDEEVEEDVNLESEEEA